MFYCLTGDIRKKTKKVTHETQYITYTSGQEIFYKNYMDYMNYHNFRDEYINKLREDYSSVLGIHRSDYRISETKYNVEVVVTIPERLLKHEFQLHPAFLKPYASYPLSTDKYSGHSRILT